MTQWYGKKGISWHVTVVVFIENGEKNTLTFVHLFENCSQDANAVIGIYDAVIQMIKAKFKTLKLYFRSDNGG